MKNTYYPHIDGLRAISVLLVILFHLDFSTFSGGYIGVDVFFVISGFLITRLIFIEIDQTGSFSFKSFYIRRFKRLFPALLITVLFTFLLSAIFFSPLDLKRTANSTIAAIISLSNVLFWLEADYFDVSTKIKPLLHTWSLSIEEQFYLFWPLLLFLIASSFKKVGRTFAIIILALFSFLLNYIFHDGDIALFNAYAPNLSVSFADGKSALFFLLPFRIFEFCFGAFLTHFFDKEKFQNSITNNALTLLGLVFIFSTSIFYDENYIFPYWAAIPTCLGASLVILFGGSSNFTKFLNNKLLVKIGILSYSLYLTHWPITVFFYYHLDEKLHFLAKIFIFILTFLTAICLHHWVEKPMRHIRYETSKIKFNCLFATLIMIFIFSILAITGDGWHWRLSPQGQKISRTGTAKAFHKERYGGEGYPRYSSLEPDIPADIVLMGDSHGLHYAEGLYQVLAKPQSLNIYYAAGTSCFHLPHFTRTDGKSNFNTACPNSLNKALKIIHKSKKPPLVVISHSWISQSRLAGITSKDGSKVLKYSVDVTNLAIGITDLKELIPNSPLIVIGEVPSTHTDLFRAYTRPTLFSQEVEAQISFSPIQPSRKKFNDEFSSKLKNLSGIYFLDPFKYLCNQYTCRNLDNDGNILYSDRHHLSKDGSKYFINRAKKDILKIVNTSQ